MSHNLSDNKVPEKTRTRNREVLEEVKRLFEQNSIYQLGENIDVFPVATCITDKEGNYVQVNQRFCHLSGYEQEELLGQHFSTLFPEVQKQVKTGLHETFIKGIAGPETESKLKNKQGEELFVISSATLLPEPQQTYAIMFILDGGATNAGKTEAEKSGTTLLPELTVEEIAENMLFHDMRKPVANIVGICNVLLSSNFDKEKRNQWISILQAEAHKSLKMLDMKAGFKKMEMDNYVPEISDFDLVGLVQAVLKPLSPEIEKRGMQTALFLEGKTCTENDCLLVSADRFFIEIMLCNLIVNAIEASSDRDTVQIDLTTQNKTDLRTDISNKGVIPAAVRESFFKKFSTFGKAKGLGLGTYTARLIARAHRGDITFFTSEEKGTTLRVLLPEVVRSV